MVHSRHFDDGVSLYAQGRWEEALTSFQQAVAVGDERAIAKLPLAAFRTKNYKVTVEHCQKHINLAECKVILGVCYYSGLGVGENFEKSERLLKGAASEGHRLAKFNLSILFNAMGKYEDEYFWCNEAAEDGNASAKIRLQEIIKHGSGIPPYRYSEYISQLQEFAGIATEGNAQFKLGSHYHYGQFGLPIDHEQAKKWYERSVVNGNEDAMNNLGSLYEHSSQIEQNYQEAAKWYSEAVKKNPEHIQAVINLSNLYMSGKGVKQDLNEALRLLLTIADTSADAKAALALLYGEGGLNDPEKAKMYQKEAAEGGSVAALSNLAKNATGEEALRYLNEAATAGDVNSQVQLAQRAMENIDYIDALYWTNHALQAGSTQAKDLLVTLGEHAETAMFA